LRELEHRPSGGLTRATAQLIVDPIELRAPIGATHSAVETSEDGRAKDLGPHLPLHVLGDELAAREQVRQ
jgi:hypothetical protein